MLARKFRLQDRREFSSIYRRGRGIHAGALSVKAQPNRYRHTRFAVVVSIKVAKKATVRNRIRRRLFGLLAELHPAIAPGFDIVVIVKQDVSGNEASNLRKLLESALKRLGLMNRL